ncbi:MAG: hypothetical protein WD426_13005 [Anditalea sp.]
MIKVLFNGEKDGFEKVYGILDESLDNYIAVLPQVNKECELSSIPIAFTLQS